MASTEPEAPSGLPGWLQLGVLFGGLVVLGGAAVSALLWLNRPSYEPFVVEGAEGPVGVADFQGQVSVIYFGYTACPDVCPTSLSTLDQAWDLLDEDAPVAGLVVSVDPKRDTPAQLEEYGAWFDERIRGGTASEDEIRRIAADWGVTYRMVKGEGAMDYTVDHSADLFVVGPDGVMQAVVPHGSSPQEVADAIRPLLPGG